MRSPRLIAIVYLKNELVVQSENFSTYYPIGSLNKTLEYLYKWGVDEIIILSIDGNYNYKILKESLKGIHLPVTFGGGITIEKGSRSSSGLGLNAFKLSHLPCHFFSTSEGE